MTEREHIDAPALLEYYKDGAYIQMLYAYCHEGIIIEQCGVGHVRVFVFCGEAYGADTPEGVAEAIKTIADQLAARVKAGLLGR